MLSFFCFAASETKGSKKRKVSYDFVSTIDQTGKWIVDICGWDPICMKNLHMCEAIAVGDSGLMVWTLNSQFTLSIPIF